MRIGYARVSTAEQDLAAQIDALVTLGIEEQDIYVDPGLTGASRARPELRKALDAVGEGDELVVTKLGRLARSIRDAKDIADELEAKGATLRLGGCAYDPTDATGKLMFNILETFAEFEADLMRMRTREGMAQAKAKGRLRGRGPKLSAARERRLVELHHEGGRTIGELAEMFNVARSTVYRAIDRAGAIEGKP